MMKRAGGWFERSVFAVVFGIACVAAGCGDQPGDGGKPTPQERKVTMAFVHAAPAMGKVRVFAYAGLTQVAGSVAIDSTDYGVARRATVVVGTTLTVQRVDDRGNALSDVLTFFCDAPLGATDVTYVLAGKPDATGNERPVGVFSVPALEPTSDSGHTLRIVNALADLETVVVSEAAGRVSVGQSSYADYSTASDTLSLTVENASVALPMSPIQSAEWQAGTPGIAVLSGSLNVNITSSDALQIRLVYTQQRPSESVLDQVFEISTVLGERQILSAVYNGPVDLRLGDDVFDAAPDDVITGLAYGGLTAPIFALDVLAATVHGEEIYSDLGSEFRKTKLVIAYQRDTGADDDNTTFSFDGTATTGTGQAIVINALRDGPYSIALAVDGGIAVGVATTGATFGLPITRGPHSATLVTDITGDGLPESLAMEPFVTTNEVAFIVVVGTVNISDSIQLQALVLQKSPQGLLALTPQH